MNIYSYNQELQLASCCTVGIIRSQAKKKVLNLYRPRNYAAFSSQSYYKYKTTTRKTIEQAGLAASESLPHIEESSLDPVPSSIRARNAQEINITNCDVTTRSWARAWVGYRHASLVPRPHPKIGKGAWCHLQTFPYVPSQHITQLILIITFTS